MTHRSWSLARRITLAFGVTAAALAITLSALAAWTVRKTIQLEVDALAKEEIEETHLYLSHISPSLEAFENIALEFNQQHPRNPLAWRFWHTGSGEPLGEFGVVELFQRVDGPLPLSTSPRVLSEELRWITSEVDQELSMGILLDVSHQVERSERFDLALLLFIPIATALVTFAGHLVGLRVARLLKQVARSARLADESLDGALEAEAPREIRDVVLALHETLRSIRKETENARVVTSGLAHELRSPLQNLIGEAQVALLRQRDPLEYRRVLESQLDELRELSRVVDNLVTLCAVGELRRRPGRERFDLGQEVRLRLDREFQLAGRRGVRLEIEASGPLACTCDRESVLLALRNVVTNAIEWSPEGGTVRVHVQSDGRLLQILVDDQGPGIPPAERGRIFEPFHRGPAARGRRAGYGLGLPLTRSAIEAHGGTIEVEDAPGGGARIRLRLPLEPREGAEFSSGTDENGMTLQPAPVQSAASAQVGEKAGSAS